MLLSAEGRSEVTIAELVGMSEPTVIKWRRTYSQRGLAGLDDAAAMVPIGLQRH
jgi:transposase